MGDSYDRVTALVGQPAVMSDSEGEGVQTYLRDAPIRQRIKTWGRGLLFAGPSALIDDVIFARFDSERRLVEVRGTGVVLPPKHDSEQP